MTLSSTPVYDTWVSTLKSQPGVEHTTAQQLVDCIIGDPRLGFVAPLTDSDMQRLRTEVRRVIDEFNLAEFGDISDHGGIRDELIAQFEATIKEMDRRGPTEEEADDVESLTVDVTDNEREFAGGAIAGAGAGPAGDDVEARDGPLSSEEVDESPDGTENEANQSTSDDERRESRSNEEAADYEPQRVAETIAADVLRAMRSDLNDDLETVPIDAVEDEMFRYGVNAVRLYRRVLRQTALSGYDEHEQEVLFEQLYESRMRSVLEDMKEGEESDG